MGLFDKKFCDVCGEKIGFLGNKKLEDGNLCKDCAKKLSPLFSERRHSTVDEIKQQLAYREENERRLPEFNPDMTFGENKKVYVDRRSAQFIVASSSNWRNVNPDLISFRQVKNVNTDIHEDKRELYYTDEEGKRRSYTPRRYECRYEFNVTILVDSPWFDEIRIELSDGNRPDSRYTDAYRRYEEQMHTLATVLKGGGLDVGGIGQKPSAPKTREEELMEEVIKQSTWTCSVCGLANHGTTECIGCRAPISDQTVLNCAKNIAHAKLMEENFAAAGGGAAPMQNNAAPMQANAAQNWSCPSCGSQNTGKFCENCGTAKPEAKPGACPRCGYVLPAGAAASKFCPECGAPLSARA